MSKTREESELEGLATAIQLLGDYMEDMRSGKHLQEAFQVGFDTFFGVSTPQNTGTKSTPKKMAISGSLWEDGDTDEQMVDDAYERLAKDLQECIQEFLEKQQEHDEWELSDYGDVPEEAACDYGSGDYDYSTKAKARLACREALRSVLSAAKENYEAEKKVVIEETAAVLADMEAELRSFAGEFRESFADYVSLDLEEENDIKERVLKAGRIEFSEEAMEKELEALDIAGRFANLMKMVFENGTAEIFRESRYMEMCSWDEDDGVYCFEMEDAVDELNSSLADFFENACEQIGGKVEGLYLFAVSEFCDRLSEKVGRILHEVGRTDREA